MLGTIQNYTQSPSGQMNGFVLASGQRVHIPESMGAQVSDKFPPNTSVQVTGHMIADPEGRPVLEADKITAPSQQRDAGPDRRARRASGRRRPVVDRRLGNRRDAVGATPASQTAPTSPGQQPPTGR